MPQLPAHKGADVYVHPRARICICKRIRSRIRVHREEGGEGGGRELWMEGKSKERKVKVREGKGVEGGNHRELLQFKRE